MGYYYPQEGDKPQPPHALLPDLIEVLKPTKKYDWVCSLLCGGCGDGSAPLEDREKCCADGSCSQCGLPRLWSSGVRKSIVTRAGNIKATAADVWKKNFKWERYTYKTTGSAAGSNTADEDGEWNASAGRRELVVEAREGNIVEYLDELEAISQKYIKHRLTLSKQRRSALEFGRVRRPGILSIDNDFGEIFTIEGARKVQSEHWVIKQATIFASVVSWLSLSEWEKQAGELGVGDEVTVHGEQYGQPVALGSYWGRVIV